jgi:GxxExxY protein
VPGFVGCPILFAFFLLPVLSFDSFWCLTILPLFKFVSQYSAICKGPALRRSLRASLDTPRKERMCKNKKEDGMGGIAYQKLCDAVLASALKVHDVLGPGLLESVYEACLCEELSSRGLHFVRQFPVDVRYNNVRVKTFIADVIVEGSVIIENKAVKKLLPIHSAQLMNYLKLCNCPVGYLFNFASCCLKWKRLNKPP